MKNLLYIYAFLIGSLVYSQNNNPALSYRQQAYSLDTLSINTKNSDFGISYVNASEVVFSSPQTDRFFLRKWLENHQGYLELYKGKLTKNGSIKDVELYSKVLNSKYHESNIAVTKNGKSVYFTSNNQEDNKRVKAEDGFTNLQLYKADLKDGEFVNVRLLPFNDDNFSTGHPTLSKDEKTLYFISDRPGGFGSTDVYKVNVLGDDSYGKVQNLGEKINSPAKEMFPFIDVDGVLYFSSDRKGTKGGLDVYGISLLNEKDTIYQLPSPINSVKDDFAFVLGKTQHGFLSSNRDEGKGDDDIYKLTFDCLQYLKGNVYNRENGEAIEKATVYLYENNKMLDSIETDEKGAFESFVSIACSNNYLVKASKFNFKNDSVNVVTPAQRLHENIVSLNLTPMGCMQLLSGKVYNKTTKESLNKANVYIYSNNMLLDSVLTDTNGQFKSSLRIKCGNEYTIKATKTNFRDNSTNLETSLIPNEENNVDIALSPYFLGNKIDIDPIYFDLNKSAIRPDAAAILDKVVETMNKFPDIIVEGGSHTDSRGSDVYNKNLSARRAKSTVDYIISQGISADRITSKGYGETELVNHCKNGIRCSKKEHQLNRRTEFKILKK